MNVSNINSATLQNLVSLTKKKEILHAQLARIESEITNVLSGKTGSKPSKRVSGRRSAGARSGKRGALKDKIVTLLKKAGPVGLSAKEISAKLKLPNQHVHVWFSTTGKKLPGLTKPARGIWALSA